MNLGVKERGQASAALHCSSEPVSSILHQAADVLSLRHGLSWMLLAIAAGSVNAGAFIASGQFVTHVTGTVTRIGLDWGVLDLMADYALVLVSFIVGAMASVLAIQARAFRGQRPLHALPLMVVAAVLMATALAGHLGAFGLIGGKMEEPTDFSLLCILSFAMGLMNASVTSSTALSVRTTHMTGPASDFGVQLGTAWLTTGSQRAQALRLAALRGGKTVSFGVGAVLMVFAMKAFGYLAFIVPGSFVLIAMARSFLPASVHAEERAGRQRKLATQPQR